MVSSLAHHNHSCSLSQSSPPPYPLPLSVTFPWLYVVFHNMMAVSIVLYEFTVFIQLLLNILVGFFFFYYYSGDPLYLISSPIQEYFPRISF